MRVVTMTIALLLMTPTWADTEATKDITPAQTIPSNFRYPTSLPALEPFQMQVRVQLQQVWPNGTTKNVTLGIAYRHDTPENGKELAQTEFVVNQEVALFTARYNWAIAQTKNDQAKKQEIEQKVVEALVNHIADGEVARATVDLLKPEIKDRVFKALEKEKPLDKVA